MRNNIRAKKNIELALKEDKISSNEGFTRLIMSEIYTCLSDYLEIDPYGSSISLETNASGVTLNLSIKAYNVKRFGLNA